MTLVEVTTPALARQFLLLPVRLYQHTPNWIRPLDADVESVFDREKNKTFRHGQCIRWILKDTAGVTIGRVAAFINDKNVLKGNKQPTGGMGFFECIQDQAAAFRLFDACRDWLAERGMQAMDGPINFGNRDRWWGLLVEGFHFEPNYQTNYNFPYYQQFFEAYGFQLYFNQLTYLRKIKDPLHPRLAEKSELLSHDPDYSFRYLKKSEFHLLAGYLRSVYNRAWANRAENPELSQAQADQIVKQMKPILDERLIYFGFYKDDPIAFFISLPELNQIFKHVNGKMNWWGKIKFAYHLFIAKTNTKAFGILFGVVPEHQGKGADGAIIMAARKVLQDEYKRYEDYEMNWIGDFNPKMINVVEQVGGIISKKHITYRKLFDPNQPFERHPILK